MAVNDDLLSAVVEPDTEQGKRSWSVHGWKGQGDFTRDKIRFHGRIYAMFRSERDTRSFAGELLRIHASLRLRGVSIPRGFNFNRMKMSLLVEG